MDDRLNNSLIAQLKEFRIEHRQLDIQIAALQAADPYPNQLLLQRLKKRKLWLKDAIVRLESKKIPDLDA